MGIGIPAKALSRELAIVVLTWNGRNDLFACLATLEKGGYFVSPFKVFVVDNGSSDGTQEAVRGIYQAVQLVENHANLGFAQGCNVGIRLALAQDFPYVLLLNNDTLVPPGSLEALVSFMRCHPDVGSAQALLLKPGDGGIVDSLGIKLLAAIGVLDEGQAQKADLSSIHEHEIFGASAAGAVYRAEMLRQVGLLNEDLFVLLEDVDLAFRLRAYGWTTWLVPSATIVHRRGISAEKRPPRSILRRHHVNRIHLSLCYWPWRHLLAFSPRVAFSILRGFYYCRNSGDGFRALQLWSKSLRKRRALTKLPGYFITQEEWIPSVWKGFKLDLARRIRPS